MGHPTSPGWTSAALSDELGPGSCLIYIFTILRLSQCQAERG